jgi:hypothetical protein
MKEKTVIFFATVLFWLMIFSSAEASLILCDDPAADNYLGESDCGCKYSDLYGGQDKSLCPSEISILVFQEWMAVDYCLLMENGNKSWTKANFEDLMAGIHIIHNLENYYFFEGDVCNRDPGEYIADRYQEPYENGDCRIDGVNKFTFPLTPQTGWDGTFVYDIAQGDLYWHFVGFMVRTEEATNPFSCCKQMFQSDDWTVFTTPVFALEISGTVTGDVADGVTITLTGNADEATETTGGGTYSFPELTDGGYTVTPSLDGCSFTPANTEVTISGASVSEVNFVSDCECVPTVECPVDAECGEVIDPECGPIDCGGDSCQDGYSCVNNICEEDICVPTVECPVDAECGEVIDPECGPMDCGGDSCADGESCVNNICEETPDIDCACDDDWKNHGQYVRCVAQAAGDLVDAGLISEAEKDEIVADAAESDCGSKK